MVSQEQLLGQTLLTEIFKPIETLGISQEKKVRKMRESHLIQPNAVVVNDGI